ncbi:MAG TPA: alpha/beta hydrolase [Polyangiaceae bacterium]
MNEKGQEPRFVHANGIRFAYLEEGSGPLVLLIHGFPDTPHTWDFVMPKIAAKGYRVVAPWTRGYAPSGIPKKDADAIDLSNDVLALIDALGEKEAILVGHDWGASAVYGATALAPSKVKKLFAVGIPHPATIAPKPSKLWGVRHFVAFKLPGAAKRFAANDFAALPALYRRWSPTWSPAPSEFDAIRETFSNRASLDAALGYYRALSFTPVKELAIKTDVPTVVFFGSDDPNTNREDYERGRKMFGGPYKIEETPGGHFLHREAPEIFTEKLLSHLE